jgi:ribonuclease D
MKIIKKTAELAATCEQFSQSDFVTVDTEFIRETTFWPELCLIQLASPQEAVIIDPLADGIDLKPFFDLMANEAVTKVFHAARQDVEIVYKLAGIIPHPLFDSQVAAMVCGFGDSISYDMLVQKVVGAQLDKSSRFTDWRRRPLSDKQLDYALADVTHLRDVYVHLRDQLDERGRLDWVNEEMAILTNPQTYDLHPDDAWQRLKMRVRKPVELAVMKEVAAWREREARNRNVPRSRVLKDDAIYEVAQQQPVDEAALGGLRTVSRGWEKSAYAKGLLAAVETALEIPKADLPRIPRPPQVPEGTGAAVELLKVLLKLIAEEQAVAPKVLASGDDLEKIAVNREAAEVDAMHGWRRIVFGDPALRLLTGQTGLCFRDRKVVLVDVAGHVSSPE